MDAANRRPQLPALSYLDIDKTKTEEESYQHRTSGAQQTYSSAPAASPSYQHQIGPPPPFSHPPSQHANNWPVARSGVHTPPESRRSSGEPYENNKLSTRQSLPSISEALGVESQTYSTSAITSQPTSLPTQYSHPQSAAPSSPPSTANRAFGMESSHSHFAHVTGSTYPYSSFRQDSAGPQSHSSSEAPKPTYAPIQDSRPPLHLQTSQSTPPSHQSERYGTSNATSPPYAQTSQASGTMAPPSFPYGYTPYPPRYAQQPPSSTHSSGPIYQPSSQYAAPSTPTSSWKSESTPRIGTEDRSATYSDSVKRHLDLFDLEAALNEIAQTSGSVLDFSRRYGDKMHSLARTTPSPSALPSMVDVEDMIAKSKIQVDSLNKIREVIVAQQVAYEQQLADQRQQHKAFYEPPPPPAELGRDSEDAKSEFAGADSKKRRGRAAPPGRCHSCNRAETPEWRRGPDGARTLCNACGLHYAKLTRKQTGSNKAAPGSSNLRPKEV